MSDEPQTSAGDEQALERKPRAAARAGAAPEPDVEKYGVAGWKERSRWFSKDFPKANAHAVAGALYDAKPGDVFSREEVAARLEAFYKHEVEV